MLHCDLSTHINTNIVMLHCDLSIHINMIIPLNYSSTQKIDRNTLLKQRGIPPNKRDTPPNNRLTLQINILEALQKSTWVPYQIT